MRFVLSTCYHDIPLIVVPQVSYLRLIYSTVGTQPDDCNRNVTGSVNYLVVGWFVSPANIGFLIPITIINGAAFVALVIAMCIAWTNGHKFRPFHPRRVIIAKEDFDKNGPGVPAEWSRNVSYHPMTVRCIFQPSFILRTNSSVCASGV